MCMLLSATSTHFKWELMLYCLHCPTLNKVFLLLLLLLLLYNQYWNIVNWTLRKNIQCHFHRISYIFIHENIFENVCKMAAILSRPQFLAASIDHDTTRHDNTCVTHVKYCNGHIFTHWCRHKMTTFKLIFLYENCSILIQIYLIIVLNSHVNNMPTWIQIMARHRIGDKPLS